MQNKKTFLAGLLILWWSTSLAQDPSIIQQYIETYRDIAVAEMQRSGIPASVKLAQGIHETMAGTSDLVRASNNHFGIKCKTGWQGESVTHDDDARGECFRKYDSPSDSYRDHSDFLKKSPRYAFLFNLDPLNYQGWAYGLKKAGYATNPRYPEIIIRLIEEYHLQDYTLIALGRMPAAPGMAALTTAQPGDTPREPVRETTAAVKTAPQPVATVQPAPEQPVYPSGEFKLNETRVIWVTRGTPFLTIATEYNLQLARLFEFNELPVAEAADRDQLIFLQRKRKTGSNNLHIVKAGETLHDIAQAEAIRMESLLELNQLQRWMQPAPGQTLYLTSRAPGRPDLARSTSN